MCLELERRIGVEYRRCGLAEIGYAQSDIFFDFVLRFLLLKFLLNRRLVAIELVELCEANRIL